MAKKKTDFNLSFTEPYLFDSKWTAGGDIFHSENNMSDSYSFKKKGLGARVGYPIFDYTRAFLNYRLEGTAIVDVNDDNVNTSSFTDHEVRIRIEAPIPPALPSTGTPNSPTNGYNFSVVLLSKIFLPKLLGCLYL